MQEYLHNTEQKTAVNDRSRGWTLFALVGFSAFFCVALNTAVLNVQDVNLYRTNLGAEISAQVRAIGAMAKDLSGDVELINFSGKEKENIHEQISIYLNKISHIRDDMLYLDNNFFYNLAGLGLSKNLFMFGDDSIGARLQLIEMQIVQLLAMYDVPLPQRSVPSADLIGAQVAQNVEQVILELHRFNAAALVGVHQFQTIFNVCSFLILLLTSAMIYRPMLLRLRREHAQLIESEKRFEHLAHHDSLTGLANRTLFNMSLVNAIERARLEGRRGGLIVFDLDRFKSINDTFGHRAGDAILKAVGDRLPTALRPNDVPTRLGGDEFAVVLSEIDDPVAIIGIANRLHGVLAEPVIFEGNVFRISASIGAAVFPDHGETADAVLGAADSAMYDAKSKPSRLSVFDHKITKDDERDHNSEQRLISAIELGQLVVYYQPKVRFLDCSHSGFEALIRWNDPERGLLSPGQFLPAAERCGLMSSITHFVIDAVARDIARWHRMGYEPGPVAVNMPEALLTTDLGMETLRKAVEEHGIGFADFGIEVTEDVFLNRSTKQIQETVEQLYSHGVRIAFDDFGTGYAALTHLRTFPFDELKIDRSFIMDLGDDPRCDQIVRALIGLAKNLGKSVVAEGVETTQQAEFLKAEGCDIAQGYLYGRPMPFEMATERLMDASIDVCERQGDSILADGEGASWDFVDPEIIMVPTMPKVMHGR